MQRTLPEKECVSEKRYMFLFLHLVETQFSFWNGNFLIKNHEVQPPPHWFPWASQGTSMIILHGFCIPLYFHSVSRVGEFLFPAHLQCDSNFVMDCFGFFEVPWFHFPMGGTSVFLWWFGFASGLVREKLTWWFCSSSVTQTGNKCAIGKSLVRFPHENQTEPVKKNNGERSAWLLFSASSIDHLKEILVIYR